MTDANHYANGRVGWKWMAWLFLTLALLAGSGLAQIAVTDYRDLRGMVRDHDRLLSKLESMPDRLEKLTDAINELSKLCR